MLDKVTSARAVRPRIRHQFAHRINLMIAGENNLLHRAPLRIVFHAHKMLNNIQQRIGRQNFAIQILGAIAIQIGGITRPIHAVALIEGQENGFAIGKPRAHRHGFRIQRKVHEGAPVGAEQRLLGAAAGLVLLHGVLGTLAGEIVFQLHRHHRNAVQKQHRIDRMILIVGQRAIAQLPHQLKAVLLIARDGIGIFSSGGFEKTQLKLCARRHADTVAQHVDDAAAPLVRFQLVCYALDELRLGLRAMELFDFRPLPRLRLAHKAHQRSHFQRPRALIIRLPLGGRSKRRPACGVQTCLHIVFKVSFVCIHVFSLSAPASKIYRTITNAPRPQPASRPAPASDGTLNLPVTASDMSERRYSRSFSAICCFISMSESISAVLVLR